MAFKILIMGLSGSGKTTLATELVTKLSEYKTVSWINADDVRQLANDWDFSSQGRLRQASRLYQLANNSTSDIIVCDFIAPLPESREIFNADFVIWLNTISFSQYIDTDQVFDSPDEYNYMFNDYDSIDVDSIVNSILGKRNEFNLLPHVQIPEFAHMHLLYSGMDSLQECADKNHFLKYNKKVEYSYNSRGFRDDEWHNKSVNLSECIWCFGDSFTVGLGQPQSEIWPNILSNILNRPVINISLDGASTNWITRQVIYVLNEINPSDIIIQWSFLNRREHIDDTKSDKDRRLMCENYVDMTDKNNINNFVRCLTEINRYTNKNNNIIHSWIPGLLPDNEYNMFITTILKLKLTTNIIKDNNQIDFSRDGYHYDINTVKNYVNNYVNLITTY